MRYHGLRIRLPRNIHLIVPPYILVGCAIFGLIRFQETHPVVKTQAQTVKQQVSKTTSIQISKPPIVVTPVQQPPKTNNEIIDAINKVRLDKGLPALIENQKLDEIANLKVKDLCTYNYWAHNNPNGTTWLYFYGYAGYSYTYAGENLGYGFSNTSYLVTGWINSPEHYQNIISANYTQTGAATLVCNNYQGEINTTIAAQEFGTP